MTVLTPDQPAFLTLKEWLIANGGSFHESVRFQHAGEIISASGPLKFTGGGPGSPGNIAVAAEDIAADATIVTCPFSLIITKELAQRNLLKLLSIENIVGWTERQWISTYICLHWLYDDSLEQPPELAHYPYIATLPTSDQLLTPLYFTRKELEAFKGSNIYQATIDRQREWRIEWQRCHSVVVRRNARWRRAFTWERYLAAATHISSRAFPSSLLSSNPTLKATVDTKPVLLPGMDSLNHKRAQPVSWFVTFPTPASTPTNQQPTISLILHTNTAAGNELFNNYGPKPNAELILGYGFSLPDNPDDTILLTIRGVDGRWEIGRSAQGADALWDDLLHIIEQDQDGDEREVYEMQMDATDMLASMVRALLGNLPSERRVENLDIRPEVLRMWKDYIEGQTAILSSLLDFCQKKEGEAVELARSLGVKLVIVD